jgi:hypothetical protein
MRGKNNMPVWGFASYASCPSCEKRRALETAGGGTQPGSPDPANEPKQVKQERSHVARLYRLMAERPDRPGDLVLANNRLYCTRTRL